MASFPTTAITYATRSNGQTIDASHINGLQEEVAAIEAGYLDGSARLNSSVSTVAALSVTGASTFTGAVTVTGAATFSTVATFSTKIAPASTAVMCGDSTTGFKEVHCSSLYVSGVAIAANSAPPAVRVRNSADTNLSSAVWTGLSWDTEDVDSTGMHSTAANSSRLTFVSTGLYAVGTTIDFGGQNNAGDRRVRIVLNDSTTIIAAVSNASTSARHAFDVTAFVRASATTDYVTVNVFHNIGSTASAIADSTIFGGSVFWAYRVST